MSQVFSTEWLNAFVLHARTAPWVDQDTKLPEYFQAVDRLAADFHEDLGFISTPVRYQVSPETEAVRLRLEAGRPQGAEIVHPSDLANTALVLAASPDSWKRILTNAEDVAKAIMYRDLYLWQGDIHSFFRRIYLVIELLRLAQARPASVQS
jgi:hypothetical protein